MSDKAYYENKLKELKRKKANVESSIIRVQSMIENDKYPQKNGKKPVKNAKEVKKSDEVDTSKKLEKGEKGYFGF